MVANRAALWPFLTFKSCLFHLRGCAETAGLKQEVIVERDVFHSSKFVIYPKLSKNHLEHTKNCEKLKNPKQDHKKLKHHNSRAGPLRRQPDLDKLLWTLRCGWNHADYQESLRVMNSWFLVMLVEKGLLRIGNMLKWYWPPSQNITMEPFDSEASKYAVDYWTSVYHNK